MSSYPADIRAFRRTKSESKANWLLWRKGKFSTDELELIKHGLETWVSEQCEDQSTNRDEILENLKWARENKITAWCDIATKCALPDRKIGAIRHCILRRFMPGCEVDRWTKEQTAEFVSLQKEYGARAWKKIAQETGRSLEDVVNKGRQMEQKAVPGARKFSKQDSLHLKLAQFLRKDSETYEFSAIRPDCILVSLVRRYTPNLEKSVHGIPGGKIAKKIRSTVDAVRLRWHQAILPEIERRAAFALNDSMDDYLLVQLLKATQGKLNDPVSGETIYPACDWNSLDFKAIAPMWSQTTTQNKLKSLLRQFPKFDLVPLPELAKQAAPATYDSEVAAKHFQEIRRIINLLADRGDQYIADEEEYSKNL